MSATELCFLTATELVQRLINREISARELMEAHLEQIERVNPKVNAIVTLAADQALEQADQADRSLRRGEATGVLHGLPLGVKDLVNTKGIRTTYGSPIYKDFIPEEDALIVEREKTAGAIIVAKTNTPEFGAGGNTFNEVFGETYNPYDLSKTCGGSSGGSAAALACGMLPLADGSDLGGSLRNPAAFCNVVGFRTSPGRVPVWPMRLGWWTLSVQGPMARTVGDVALFLSAIAGPDPRSPISIQEPADIFSQTLEKDFKDIRIAWSRNLGFLPVMPVINDVCDAQRRVFEDLGCIVEDAHPDFTGATDVFNCLRAWKYTLERAEELENYRHLIKDTVIWNTEAGFKLDGPTVARAEAKRTEIYHRVREFMQRYEFLVLPVNAVPPFPVEQRYVTEINGVKMNNYIEAGALRYMITLTGLPAISVPCGFTPDGLPVGLQIVGGPNRDVAVLQLANAFERATKFYQKRPSVVEDADLNISG
jgi:amidase